MKKLKFILLFLMVTNSLFAVDEIPVDYPTGQTLYACRFDGLQVFLSDGSGIEDWIIAANYAVTMTENGVGGHYVGPFDPDTNIGDGTYKITVYHQIGGSPANSDPAVSVGTIVWVDGAEYSLPTNLILVLEDTDELQGNQGDWATATGFATPTNVTDAHIGTNAKIDTTDVLIGALNDFDSTSDPVEILASGGTAGKNAEELVNDFWDEPLTGALHNDATSAGRRLRQVAAPIMYNENLPAQTGINNSNQIKLDTDASSIDGAYDPSMICIVSGTGVGQSRLIYQYDGSSRTATVDRNWKVNPEEGDEVLVHGHPGREHVNEGLAQQGSSSIIRLNALASSANDAYKNQFVFIRSGTGEDQVRRIISYNGTTKDATVSEAWNVNPDSTSAYVILPFACVDAQAIAGTELTPETGANFNTFFDAGGNVTTTEVDDIDSILVLSSEAIDWFEADEFIDDSNPAQWQIVTTKKQSGGGGAELGRKDYKDIDGNPIVGLTKVFAETQEP